MGRDQDQNDAGQYEWVNAWARSAQADTACVVTTEPAPASAAPAKAADAIVPTPVIAPMAHTLADDQLMRDIAEIERARDALAAMPVAGFSARRRTQALTLVPARTTDLAPVIVGGVLALVMLTVFGAAAAMTKLAR